LSKEYDFALDDLNYEFCCQIVVMWSYQLLSYLTSDRHSQPINFYNT